MILEHYKRIIIVSKKICNKCNIGIILGAVGIGFVISVIIPFGGYVIAVGGGLIFLGWYLTEHHF